MELIWKKKKTKQTVTRNKETTLLSAGNPEFYIYVLKNDSRKRHFRVNEWWENLSQQIRAQRNDLKDYLDWKGNDTRWYLWLHKGKNTPEMQHMSKQYKSLSDFSLHQFFCSHYPHQQVTCFHSSSKSSQRSYLTGSLIQGQRGPPRESPPTNSGEGFYS